jgi:hypothetical protein
LHACQPSRPTTWKEILATDMQARLAELVKPILETIEHTWNPFHLITPDLQGARAVE